MSLVVQFFGEYSVVYQPIWDGQTSSKVLLTSVERHWCGNKAKMRNRLKFAGVPQTCQQISDVMGRSSPYCRNIWRRYCCLTSFFPIVDTFLSSEDIAGQSCAMVPRWQFFGDFFRPAFSASHVQHISDMHSKFTLRPHHVWKYGRYPICDSWY